MKVLLIYPQTNIGRTPGIPLGIFYLAGALQNAGIECRAIDGRIQGEEVIRQAMQEFYDVVGITCLSHTRWDAIRLARQVKRSSPDSKVVLGGPHVTVMHKQIEEHFPEVDLCIRGDGEYPFLSYIEYGEPEYGPWHVDDYPWPAWEQVNFSLYPPRGRTKRDLKVVNGVTLRKTTPVSILSSRGCVGHCTFCSWTTWKDYRVRDPLSVADEVNYLSSRFNQRHYEFVDDCWGANRDKALELCDRLTPLKVAWRCNTRADCTDRELVQAMKRAGCYRIFIGVESGSERMLGEMHKRETLQQVEDAVRLVKSFGIYVACGFLVGLPGETDGTMEETREFMRRSKPNEVNVGEGVYILPGTALFAQAKREHLIDDDFWLTQEPLKMYQNGFTQADLFRWSERLKHYNMREGIKTEVIRLKQRIVKRYPWVDKLSSSLPI